MRAGADLTMRGITSLLGEFLERLDLREVTLGVSDWDGPPTLRGRRRSLTKVLLSAESGRTVVEPDATITTASSGASERLPCGRRDDCSSSQAQARRSG